MPSRSLLRRGFTLIELLIVVVIIGILATIAIPKFANTKGKAIQASMVSDLRNLASAEEGYFYEKGHYTATLADLSFSPSANVTITVTSAAGPGWVAIATSSLLPGRTCGLFMGTVVVATAPAVQEGVVRCQ
jgi:prepilin-type N-terminal cleavage/methylation domain-containing protein